jgi:hypothetical protein
VADRTVSVVLVAKIGDYERGMAQATAITKKFESELKNLQRPTLELKHVGETADDVSHDLDQLAATSVVAGHQIDNIGDQAKGAAADLAILGHELDSVDRKAGSLGGSAAKVGGGLISTLGDLGASLRGSMIPLLVGVGAAASPAIASAVGAAVVGGVGLGGIIGGIALAARDPRVPAAFKPLGAQMMVGLTKDAKVFVGPLLQVAEDIGKGWEARIRPHIAAAFTNLAPSLRGLSAGGTGFLEHIAAGFEKISVAAGPFLNQFGRDLPELGADIERFMNSVSEAGPEVTRFFHDMNSGLGTTIAGLGKFIQFGAELNDVLPVGGLVASLGRLSDATDTNVETNDAWIRSLFGVAGGLMNISKILDAHHSQSGVAATATSAIQASMQAMNSQLVTNAANAAVAGAATSDLTASFQAATRAAGGLSAAWDVLNGKTLSADESLLAAKTAVDAVGESFKANKGKIDGSSEAALNNRIAMGNAGKAAADAAQKYIEAGGSIDGARKIMRDQQKAAEDAAVANGGNAKKVHELAGEMFKLPKSVNPKVNVTVSGRAAVDALAGAISGLHSKTVTVTSIVQNIVSGAKVGAGHAAGTSSAPPGLAWVGERGPELMSFKGGERVFPHQQSMSMARGYAGGTGGGSAPVNLTVNLQIDSFGNISRKALISDAQGRGVGEATIRTAYP